MYLKAVIQETPDGDRLFINGTEFPYPINDWESICSWPADGHPDKVAVSLEILVDEVVVKEWPSD